MKAQAKTHTRSMRSHLIAWRDQHRKAASASATKLIDRPLSSTLIWLVVAVSLALPGLLLVALDHLEAAVSGVDESANVSLLLDTTASRAEAEALKAEIADWPEVARIVLIDRDQALNQLGQDTGLEPLLGSLKTNPLPHVLSVMPVAADVGVPLSALATRLQSLPGVARVILDTQWLQRFELLLQTGWRFTVGLGLLMGAGSLLVLGNILRLAIEARSEELAVISLIGGSAAFARRPFLYTGLFYGLGGGLLAALLLMAVIGWLAGPVNQLFLLYHSNETLTGPTILGVMSLVAVGALLGWASAWVAVQRYLWQQTA